MVLESASVALVSVSPQLAVGSVLVSALVLVLPLALVLVLLVVVWVRAAAVRRRPTQADLRSGHARGTSS